MQSKPLLWTLMASAVLMMTGLGVATRDIAAANAASSDVDAAKGINCAATHTCACDHLSTTCGLIRLRRLQSGFLSGCA